MKTLSEFIVERQAEYPNAKGELSGILSSIRLLAKSFIVISTKQV